MEKIEKLTQEIPFPIKDFKELSLKEYIIQKDDFFTAPVLTTYRNVQATTDYKRGGLEKIFEWEEK